MWQAVKIGPHWFARFWLGPFGSNEYSDIGPFSSTREITDWLSSIRKAA